MTGSYSAAVSVPWAGEDGALVTVQATFDMSRGGMRVAGVPDRGVVPVAPGDSGEISRGRDGEISVFKTGFSVQPAGDVERARAAA